MNKRRQDLIDNLYDKVELDLDFNEDNMALIVNVMSNTPQEELYRYILNKLIEI